MKKKIIPLLFCLFFLFINTLPVHADMGPKPSVNLEFTDIDSPYYVTLLSKYDHYGPYHVSNEPIEKDSYMIKKNHEEGIKAWQAFRDYHDSDGFYFIEYFEYCEDNHFNWTYYPPDTFKILIYFPETNTFAVSEVIETYAFDSYYQVQMEENLLTAKQNYNFSQEILSLVIRVVITIAIEILIAYLFNIRNKKMLRSILMVNIVTQLLLNIALNYYNYYCGTLFLNIFYLLLELIIFVMEGSIYRDIFKKQHHPFLYSFTANLISFITGVFLIQLLPGIF